MNLKKQLACLYTNYFFTGLRITDAVWVALLAARGFSLWEIGFAESVFHIISLLCEVPSGMAADLLGRKKALVFGGVCVVLYNLLMAFAPNLFFICVAMGLNAFASTMFSADLRQPQAVRQNRRLPQGLRHLLSDHESDHRSGLPLQHTGTLFALFRFLPAECRL
ncbi:MAG: hypothetical protein BHW25_07895 [Faecalibacterium sp. CAG:82-related_59_9]|nr:MAG: hypothetical protein BHW25_07895 [Faecalibacterium sp. CAG:82-related_59_9]